MIYLAGHTTFNGINDLLKGDGRKTVQAPAALGPLRSNKFSISSVRMTINAFMKQGGTNHSGSRMMLGFVIDYCEANAISYELHATFTTEGKRAGYWIKRVPNYDVKKAFSEQEP